MWLLIMICYFVNELHSCKRDEHQIQVLEMQGLTHKLEDSLDKILSMCNQLEMFSADSNLGTSNTPV